MFGLFVIYALDLGNSIKLAFSYFYGKNFDLYNID
jgi:hypothetical protein